MSRGCSAAPASPAKAATRSSAASSTSSRRWRWHPGLPVPEIYVLEQEAGINAFAAGLSPADAAIAVTRGALEHLERAELQGVIAHEFSHILNGDMRLNQQLIGLSFGILVLSLVGRWLLRSARYTGGGRRGRNSGGVAAALAIGVALVVIGGIGVLLSRLIKAGVSRQRERLADASAVQFTREPEGLAGALKKIGGYSARIVSVDTEEVAHMLFERGTRPLQRLVRDASAAARAHPGARARLRSARPARAETATGSAPRRHRAGRGGGRARRRRCRPPPRPSNAPARSRRPRGARCARPCPTRCTTPRARAIRACSSSWRSRCRATSRRAASSSPSSSGSSAQPAPSSARRLFDEIAARRPNCACRCSSSRLPTLRQRPREQLAYLSELLVRVQELEKTPRLFDFVLLRVLKTYLRDLPGRRARRAARASARCTARFALGRARPARQRRGVRQRAARARARAAYEAGLASVGWRVEPADPTFEPPAAARDLERLDAALAALASIRPREKERVLRGVLAAIRADAVTATEERELFRLIAGRARLPAAARRRSLAPAGACAVFR